MMNIYRLLTPQTIPKFQVLEENIFEPTGCIEVESKLRNIVENSVGGIHRLNDRQPKKCRISKVMT